MTIKKTSAVTQSVANTAKRVIVIVGVAIVMGESLNPLKLAGCAIGIGGVFLYSVIDQLLARSSAAGVRARAGAAQDRVELQARRASRRRGGACVRG